MLQYARKASALVGARTTAELEEDEDRVLALVGALILMGEAVAQLSEAYRSSLPHMPWRQAKNLRNLLVHRYFEIRFDQLADMVRTDLPALVRDLERAMAEGEETP